VTARTRPIAGAAALAYVVAAAVENMDVLDAPLLGASRAEIRAALADQALGLVTSVAGLVALACYVVFAFAARPRWAPVAVAGALLAAVGILLGRNPDLFDWQLRLRFLAGPLMAVFLLAARDAFPRSLQRLAGAVSVGLVLTPFALTGDHGRQITAALAFSTHALWIWLAALWLLFGGRPPAEFARRSAFLMLVVAAGMVGVALLIVPGATETFFAWGLKPDSLAAFAGGVYVGSAVVYAAGIRNPRAARPLVPAAVVLSVSVLFWTLVHLEVFDLGRLQAWAWLVLFAGFGLVTTALALRRHPRDAGPPLPGWARVVFATVAAALGVVGVALWADPVGFGLPPLGGRFAGSWTVMLAVLSGWAAARNRADEACLPALALVTLPLGALLGAAQTGVHEPAYLAGLAALFLAGIALLSAAPDAVARRSRAPRIPGPRSQPPLPIPGRTARRSP
jgi:hypothetical protein